jgi:rSAM/selenodomain-associated transferase 1
MAEATLARTERGSYRRLIFYTPSSRRNEFLGWLGANEALHPQRGAHLGERLINAFGTAFREGASKVAVIGTDIPLIDRRILHAAFRRLDRYDCVVGPSSDGGYYLLGLNAPSPELFRGIAWGTGRVLEQTLAVTRSVGLSYCLLREQIDMDCEEDLIIMQRILHDKRLINRNGLNKLALLVDEMCGSRVEH